MFKRKKSTGKSFPVKITTMDAELEFSLRWKATGQELFDLVCRTIGLRETWYFGLQYEDSKGYVAWLKMDKRVRDQDVNKATNEPVHFLVSYHPGSKRGQRKSLLSCLSKSHSWDLFRVFGYLCRCYEYFGPILSTRRLPSLAAKV